MNKKQIQEIRERWKHLQGELLFEDFTELISALDESNAKLKVAREGLEYYEECWLEGDPDAGKTARKALEEIGEGIEV